MARVLASMEGIAKVEKLRPQQKKPPTNRNDKVPGDCRAPCVLFKAAYFFFLDVFSASTFIDSKYACSTGLSVRS